MDVFREEKYVTENKISLTKYLSRRQFVKMAMITAISSLSYSSSLADHHKIG